MTTTACAGPVGRSVRAQEGDLPMHLSQLSAALEHSMSPGSVAYSPKGDPEVVLAVTGTIAIMQDLKWILDPPMVDPPMVQDPPMVDPPMVRESDMTDPPMVRA